MARGHAHEAPNEIENPVRVVWFNLVDDAQMILRNPYDRLGPLPNPGSVLGKWKLPSSSFVSKVLPVDCRKAICETQLHGFSGGSDEA